MSGAPNQLGEALLGRLAGSPDVCLQRFDLVRETALLIDIGAAALREASFLDDRVLKPSMQGSWVALRRVVEAAGAVRLQPLHFIFHTGHVGSTLVSRLLDETRSVLPLREPAALRELADTFDRLSNIDSLIDERGFGVLAATLLRLWSRGDAATQAIVLKATSSAGRIAPALLRQSPASRAIYLNLRAEPYIATLVGGANATIDLRGLGPERFRRLAAYGAVGLTPMHRHTKGQLAAASWLAETWSQQKAADAHGERVLTIDFDALLQDVTAHVARIVKHFGLPHDASYLANIGNSAVMQRYAKAPEHAYSPALRAQILGQARAQHADEIRAGLSWLETLAAASPTVAAVCTRGGL